MVPPPYTEYMSAMREELHHLVDELPEDRLAPVLQLIREDAVTGRRAQAAVTLEHVRERMHGVTDVDEELQHLRDGGRG
jgi:hypothetical protein